ncbi:MAG: adenylate/guanylate cyclase domain-containing protein [Pseudomonadota bacterium]
MTRPFASDPPGAAWSIGPVIDWLLREGRLESDPLKLVGALGARLTAAGAPLWRLRLGFFTIHPQVAAWAYVWVRGREPQIERFPHGVRESGAFMGSPAQRMMQSGAPVRARLDRLRASDHRVLHELAAEGGTDYALLPLRFADGSLNVFAVATDGPGGFGAADMEKFEQLSHALAAVLEAGVTHRIAQTLLDTYVGRRTGRRILAGQIQRGAAETIPAALWYGDLRDFTRYTESLPAPRLLGMLNAYFELVAKAVEPRGGEILRFMGDAMLIVFAAGREAEVAPACAAAVDAALDAFSRVALLNRERVRAGEPEIRFGVGLTAGEVVYGNVGAPDRLDFTVIGPAVNRAARLEALTKELGVPLLMAGEFARCLGRPVRSRGSHRVKGLAEPIEVWELE